MNTISASDFLSTYKPGETVVIDVRRPDEYAYRHIPQSINLPIEELKTRLNEIPKNCAVYLICQSGMRSAEACRQLDSLGLSHLSTIAGGLNAFEKAGGKIVQGRTPLPLMRQVQIAAGSLVLLGIVLSFLLHPVFLVISFLVGCGLIFAGISGLCGMAALLEKMPWNQNQSGAKKSC